MDLYEAWQRRRWKKFKSSQDLFNPDQEAYKPRITQADVLREHETLQARNSSPPSRQVSSAVGQFSHPVDVRTASPDRKFIRALLENDFDVLIIRAETKYTTYEGP